jgi:glucoamylase
MAREAPGQPGCEPRWTTGAKTAVGTAVSRASPVWFTLARGIVTEVFYPRVDTAALRDAQFLVLTPDGRFCDEPPLLHRIRYVDPDAPLFELTSEDPRGAFRLVKEIVAWPEGPALLVRVRLETSGDPGGFRVFWLVAPHLGNQGADNSARRVDGPDGPGVVAWRGSAACYTAARPAFVETSVGFVCVSDGWTLLARDGGLRPYDVAAGGNVALTAALAPFDQHPVQIVAVGFGSTPEAAALTARLALEDDFDRVAAAYAAGWHAYLDSLSGLLPPTAPHSRQQRISAMVIKTHQDKTFPGGLIASLAVPWGDAAGDGNRGGYHLVWPRDLVEAAEALLALGDIAGAREALRYLLATQKADGSWPQNYWLDGSPYWLGAQLDETALPIHLAWRLWSAGALPELPRLYPALKRALAYLATTGPVTEQDRWEEDGGYSPYTLAVAVAALVCGAELARAVGEEGTAGYLEALADYWASQVDRWTYVTDGQVLPGHPCHYERIRPAAGDDVADLPGHRGVVPIRNRPPGPDANRRENAIIDGGFLALVRHGIKDAHDPHIVTSVAVYDRALAARFPYGRLWYRYNGDGYGEAEDGAPFTGAGRGRPWPLLAGERGHYAVARGESAEPYLAAMEGAASEAGMIPEQVWDGPDLPDRGLYFGRPSGSAMPLVWAHAEYVKLVRSARDGVVFEQFGPVRERFSQGARPERVFWQFNHRRRTYPRTARYLRVAVRACGRVVYTVDEWRTPQIHDLVDSGLGMFYADLDVAGASAVEFTFYWTEAGRWEGQNFRVEAEDAAAS